LDDWVSEVDSSFAVTTAPCTAAPDASVTVPLIELKVCWALAPTAARLTIAIKNSILLIFFNMHSPWNLKHVRHPERHVPY
jgi:hypothetical protein